MFLRDKNHRNYKITPFIELKLEMSIYYSTILLLTFIRGYS